MQRNAMDMGVAANERANQTAYDVKRLNFLKVIWATWCRGSGKIGRFWSFLAHG
jgi:hypothetical protein